MTKLPTSVAEMVESQARLFSPESRQAILALKPQPSDVFITPFGRSGTTWLQQIVHGLRTQGSMDFQDISLVVPFMERAFLLDLNLNAPQVAEPRAFKAHMSWEMIPKGGRYIVSVRDPKDVLVSIYHFFEGAFFEPGAISISSFAREWFMTRRTYWSHLASWWTQRNNPDVLILSFETMKRDLLGTVQTISRFIDCQVDENTLAFVVQQSSYEFMQAHREKFDDQTIRQAVNRYLGIPTTRKIEKVRQGEVGAHQRELPGDICIELDTIWREEIESRIGYPSYQALRENLAESRGQLRREIDVY